MLRGGRKREAQKEPEMISLLSNQMNSKFSLVKLTFIFDYLSYDLINVLSMQADHFSYPVLPGGSLFLFTKRSIQITFGPHCVPNDSVFIKPMAFCNSLFSPHTRFLRIRRETDSTCNYMRHYIEVDKYRNCDLVSHSVKAH